MRHRISVLRNRLVAVFVLLLLGLPLWQGCATVKPYQMEFLTDPIMLFEEINPDVGTLEFLVFGDMEKAWVTGGGASGGGCVSCAGR
ncbi:MAG: hypothetical protein JW759_10270 [Candidatus Coatesbacteria bacterium]|nr:hypothetical protein [Candidatus Coatesbacteria bacterium]